MSEFKFPDELEDEKSSRSVEIESNADEIEIEVVDDTPQADRGRKALDKEVEDPTDEEIASYGDKVKVRIKELTHARHDEPVRQRAVGCQPGDHHVSVLRQLCRLGTGRLWCDRGRAVVHSRNLEFGQNSRRGECLPDHRALVGRKAVVGIDLHPLCPASPRLSDPVLYLAVNAGLVFVSRHRKAGVHSPQRVAGNRLRGGPGCRASSRGCGRSTRRAWACRPGLSPGSRPARQRTPCW